MNKQDRKAKLLPNGMPKWVRVYDNGGLDAPQGTCDRYTVVYTGKYRKRNPDGQFNCDHQVVSMSGAPFHPQGFCQHAEYKEVVDAPHGWAPAIGTTCHLGRRIKLTDLPADCFAVVLQDYKSIWGLP